MTNLTSVGISSGVPNSGTGTVSTIDGLMAEGGQATLGAKADAKSSATDTTAVSGISIWKQISFSIQAAATSLASLVSGAITPGTAGSPATQALTMQGISGMVPVTSQMAEAGNIVSGAITTAMTGTTSTSLVAAPGASLRNYITTLIVSNSHATVGTDVVIQDGSGGTTLLTIPAAAVYGGAIIPLPVPLRQPTTNTALYCANVTTGASVKVSAVGFKAA